jgi:chemotaxis receptor (MCP) glutamine deamidase CheD
LVSLAAQRFVAQVLEEASNAHQMRKMAPPAKLKEAGYDPKDKRDLLTVEDLVKAMEEVGTERAGRLRRIAGGATACQQNIHAGQSNAGTRVAFDGAWPLLGPCAVWC